MVLISLVWAGGVARAQWSDPNCYFPQIGVPGEIDTIYGAVYGQGLGGGLIKNLGPRPDGTPGNIIVGDLDRVNHDSISSTYYQAKTGPGFNLHNLSGKRMNLTDQQIGSKPVFAHLRTSKTLDLFNGHQIFWADDSGNYDSSRVTTLRLQFRGSDGMGGLGAITVLPTYVAKLTSDTVEDLVATGYVPIVSLAEDSVFVALFKGGTALAAKDTSYEDTSLFAYPFPLTDPDPAGHIYRVGFKGDFRGTGRDDWIVEDDSGSMCFYRNEPPFSLTNFVASITHDTIMAWWQQPAGFEVGPGVDKVSMRALPKAIGDSSMDLVLQTGRWGASDDSAIAIFRGGPQFGMNRITLDSAAFVIRHPKYLDPSMGGTHYWPVRKMDAGDMTGTGNHVLYVAAGGTAGYFFDHFYVMGKALDEKTDMYVAGGGGVADTLTADGDKYGDMLFSFPGYTSDSDLVNYGKRYAGTLRLYHGSMNIPVHLNPRWAGVRSAASIACGSLTLSPNPAGARTVADILWPDDGLVHLSIYDVMGRSMRTEEYRLQGGETQLSIPLSELPAGVYYVGLEGSSCSATARVVKIGDRTSGPANSFFQNIRSAIHGGVPALPQASPLPR